MASSKKPQTAEEEPAVESAPAPVRVGVLHKVRRLYNGDTDVDFVGRRRLWYAISVLLMVGSIGFVGVHGFNLGIEFAGGNQFEAAVVSGVDVTDVEDVVEEAGVEVASSQTAGTGESARYIVRTEGLDQAVSLEVREALAELLDVAPDEVAVSEVSSSWGTSVSEKAVYALIVFLVLVVAYLWWRYELKMAAGALVALVHDLVLTAGIYALVGFEVTPGTVVGILTILGYSLYDTVVVYDKVYENTKDAMGGQKWTYAEGANMAVNQTLMRSINTSIIGLLPVAGLLFVGAGVLGVGTLKDLALVLFVGMLTGTYSSLFLATPVVVDLRYREPSVRAQDRKVRDKRTAAEAAAKAAESKARKTEDAEEKREKVKVGAGAGAPRPGQRPASRGKKKRR